MDLKIGLLALSFLVAAWTFVRNTRVRRAEWLSSLYDTFYVKPHLKGVRAALDYEGSEHDELIRCIQSDKENWVRLEPLVDYLNFFEFIAVLWRMGQLSKKEIRLLFGYYLRNLGTKPTVEGFCRDNGFKNLVRLLEKLRYVESVKA